MIDDGSLTQRKAGWGTLSCQTTITLSCGVNDNAVAVGRRGGTSTTSDSRQVITAISSSGFTLQNQNANPGSSYPIYFLALKSKKSDYALGTISGPTTSGAQTQTISLPFVP